MVFKNSILCGFCILLLPILIAGCVITPAYELWEYNTIDYNIHHKSIDPEYVYIPRYRPRPMYLYERIWYAEPYTILIYEDSTGYKIRQKVPNSQLRRQMNKSRPYMKRARDVESIMEDVKKERRKMQYNQRKRKKNTKVYSVPVDTNNRAKVRRRVKGRT